MQGYALQLKKLPEDYYPWFDICHIILCVLSVRKESGRSFAWNHPVAAWLSCIVASFAGSIICNPLLGKPILDAVKDEQMVIVVTVVYLAVFFAPKDLVYDLIKIVPVYYAICVLKEILRAKKVYKGLEEGRQAMPANGSYLFIPVLIATLKGNGSGFAAPIVRFFRGDWQAGKQEVIKPSMATKLCLASAILLTLVSDHELVYLGMVGVFIAVKLTDMDPFKPLEEIFWNILSTMTLEGRVKID